MSSPPGYFLHLALPLLASAHSNLIIPRPRNSIDATTDPRFGPNKFPQNDGKGTCSCVLPPHNFVTKKRLYPAGSNVLKDEVPE
jgi:hypothetical protein